MRIIITGSRHWINYKAVQMVIDRAHDMAGERAESLYVRHGDNPKGADRMARNIVNNYQLAGLPLIFDERFPADWDKYGKPAGVIRNGLMLTTEPLPVDEVHTFPLQDSIGTLDMMRRADAQQIPVYNWGYPVDAPGKDMKYNIGQKQVSW